MELPSIKLNIFKKIEYFLVLKKLNQQFDAQFKIVCDPNNGSTVLPTWEIEKKILFWSYGYHKHLGSPFEKRDFDVIYENNKLQDIFISANEINGEKVQIANQAIQRPPYHKVFLNLVQRGFAEEVVEHDCEMQNHTAIGVSYRNIQFSAEKKWTNKEKDSAKKQGFIITEKGLAFGELLWFLSIPQRCIILPHTLKKYFRFYNASFILKRYSFSFLCMQAQLWSLYIFTLFAALSLIVKVLEELDLTRQAHNFFIQLLPQLYDSDTSFLWLIVFSPFLLFFVGFSGGIMYDWLCVPRKYKKIEILK